MAPDAPFVVECVGQGVQTGTFSSPSQAELYVSSMHMQSAGDELRQKKFISHKYRKSDARMCVSERERERERANSPASSSCVR